ncbi:hypothetical protein BOX15_Mlig027671g1 [Macrostomum lignano]|uniref:BLOC-1-related complex subunit 6 C-terminal helix domain-containing protein n=3 Tax=Macrostomum lignano TaxID=282301 RepID=A0A267FGJ6_9PLAT|nr:hypothetical protein BOX15_Mlig027671g1 [Macrostomum lignano]
MADNGESLNSEEPSKPVEFTDNLSNPNDEDDDESTEPCRSNSDDSQQPQAPSLPDEDSPQQEQQQQLQLQKQQQQKQQLEFVADDFVARIRAASAVKSSISGSSISSWASSSNYGAGGSAVAGAPGVGVSRSTSYPIGLLAQVTPDDIPEIDPHALADLETHARRLSDQLIHLTASLRAGLQAACGITAQHSRLHKQSVDSACDTVETAIRHMYALMARCEEVASAMSSVHQLKHDVDNVKRILDRLEASLH